VDEVPTKRWLIAALQLLFLPSPASAGWEEGAAAYKGGDYAMAFQEWLPTAEQGYADAQAHLSYLYADGRGEPGISMA